MPLYGRCLLAEVRRYLLHDRTLNLPSLSLPTHRTLSTLLILAVCRTCLRISLRSSLTEQHLSGVRNVMGSYSQIAVPKVSVITCRTSGKPLIYISLCKHHTEHTCCHHTADDRDSRALPLPHRGGPGYTRHRSTRPYFARLLERPGHKLRGTSWRTYRSQCKI